MEQFLPTLLKTLPDYAEAVVCDNASSDDSVSFMKERFPQVRLLLNDRNEGFARGYNIALQQVEATYYCLLNSDIEVTDGWIEPVIEQMDANEKIAAVQPKLLSYARRDEFEYAGASGGFIDKYGYPFCRGRVFQNLEKDEHQYDTPMEVFWATGACMFVRADLYHQLGGLDDSFFAHMEEIDLCWRLKNAGFKVYCCPQSWVFHIGGGTLPKNSPRKTYLNFRNNLSLLVKNLPKHRVHRIILYRIFLDWVAAFKFLIEGCPKDFRMVFKAHWDFYKRLKELREKRRGSEHKLVSCIYRKNIVFESIVRGKKKFNELLSGFITKPQGKPTLVPESDKRPAINTAKDDFNDEE